MSRWCVLALVARVIRKRLAASWRSSKPSVSPYWKAILKASSGILNICLGGNPEGQVPDEIIALTVRSGHRTQKSGNGIGRKQEGRAFGLHNGLLKLDEWGCPQDIRKPCTDSPKMDFSLNKSRSIQKRAKTYPYLFSGAIRLLPNFFKKSRPWRL